eukprot:12058557-Ditylum_brightwellii.AAC.1
MPFDKVIPAKVLLVSNCICSDVSQLISRKSGRGGSVATPLLNFVNKDLSNHLSQSLNHIAESQPLYLAHHIDDPFRLCANIVLDISITRCIVEILFHFAGYHYSSNQEGSCRGGGNWWSRYRSMA